MAQARPLLDHPGLNATAYSTLQSRTGLHTYFITQYLPGSPGPWFSHGVSYGGRWPMRKALVLAAGYVARAPRIWMSLSPSWHVTLTALTSVISPDRSGTRTRRPDRYMLYLRHNACYVMRSTKCCVEAVATAHSAPLSIFCPIRVGTPTRQWGSGVWADRHRGRRGQINAKSRKRQTCNCKSCAPSTIQPVSIFQSAKECIILCTHAH